MPWPTIHKAKLPPVAPNLRDYASACASFRWEDARRELDGLPGGGLNIAHEAIDRHVAHGRGGRLALRCLGTDNAVRDFTYADLAAQTGRFADALRRLGVGRGERVFGLLGRVPELYVAVLGTLKAGCVFSPLFSAFGPEPIRQRMQLGGAAALVTTPSLYVRKIADWRSQMPELKHVLLVGEGEMPAGTTSLAAVMADGDPATPCAFTRPDDMALLHFTSGTTGRPKGAVHAHEAAVAHHMTGKLALDLHPDDVFWCTADPGWVTGISYGVVSPLTNGVSMIVDEAEFDAKRWYRVLEEQAVTVWYTAPTAIRMLMKAGADLVRERDLSRLRFLASVGEPLNPEAVVWSQEVLGRPFHDNWWQTETGGIMIANYAAEDVKPGSMGRPLPGIAAAIVIHEKGSNLRVVDKAMTLGELALRPGWPSMFRGYLGDEERYRKCFADGWYLTGDLAMRDEDGYFWFVGRADDVIKSAGHLIGPFEVESAFLEHPAVAEAGAIGVPDEMAGEIVKVFVSLKPGFEPSESLRKELIGHGRKRLGRAVAPKAIDFRPTLPRTRSGKIMRRLLKARELGLPEGDTSTLEEEFAMTAGKGPPKAHLTRPHFLDLFRQMLRIRRFEEKCAELYQQEKIRGFLHLYIGEEAIAVGVMQALNAEDAVVATYREHGHALARGISMFAVMAEMYGKYEGCSRGRGGSMHLFDAATRFYGGNAIVGGGLPLAVGLALADRMQNRPHVTACFFGEGAVAEGEFHESMNMGALWKLPVLFVCENNYYAMGTALARSEAQTDLQAKAASYGLASEVVDGMDAVAVEVAARRATEAIRAGAGPRFLECQTYRFRPHSMFDPEHYREKAEVEKAKARDPIARMTEWGRAAGYLHDLDVSNMEQEIGDEIAAAVDFAERGTWEPVEQLTRHVYADRVAP